MKSPESCESSLRNRKKKENVVEKSEKSAKNPPKSSEKLEDIPKEADERSSSDESLKLIDKSDSIDQGSGATNHGKFRIQLEFDPMSLTLFALAIVTRFFRLSEPRNVVWVCEIFMSEWKT